MILFKRATNSMAVERLVLLALQAKGFKLRASGIWELDRGKGAEPKPTYKVEVTVTQIDPEL